MKKLLMIIPVVVLLIPAGCNSFIASGNLQNVGMLVETTIHDQPWVEKGYAGLLAIEEQFNADVYYKEGVKTKRDVREAIDDLADNGVNLIFGHSTAYGQFFKKLSSVYPDIHFVYFNGGHFADNVTSYNFNAHSMGFFAGMLAGEMTETNHTGIIGAFEWQPEIEGFFEGVAYQNPEAEVHQNYVNDWNGEEKARDLYRKMRDREVDVVYPAGNAYSSSVIELASEDSIYAIGYVTDQSEIAEETVLTSTVQHVDKLYTRAAEKFNENDLSDDVLTVDFQDDAISLGDFSPEVPQNVQDMIEEEVKAYKETGLLPDEREAE